MKWKENPQKFKNSGESIMAALAQSARMGQGNEVPSASDCGNLCFQQLHRSYEPKFGGFSKTPKFPQPVNLSFLLRWHVLNKGPDSGVALEMCVHTLRMMAKGGIFDHVSLVSKTNYSVSRYMLLNVCLFLYEMARVSRVTRPTRSGTCRILKRCCTIKPSWPLFIRTRTF